MQKLQDFYHTRLNGLKSGLETFKESHSNCQVSKLLNKSCNFTNLFSSINIVYHMEVSYFQTTTKLFLYYR